MANYDVLGNIAVIKFPRKTKAKEKKIFASKFLRKNKSVSTILEKTGKFSGRLRTLKTSWIAGEKTKEVLYKENGCIFRFNVDSCYFSPRLSSERLEIAKQVKKNESILVMFGGVAPFAIVIAKHSKAKRVVSVELSRACFSYALQNVRRNKLQDRVEILQGDVKRIIPKLKQKFDRIVMTRPNLKDSFLQTAFKASKKGTIIHYYCFYDEIEALAKTPEQLIEQEAKKAKKKIRILKIKKAGDIGKNKFRYRVDLKLLN